MSADPTILDTPQRDLTQFLSYRVVRLHHALNAQAGAILDKVAGVTLIQWRIINMIGSGVASSARDIAQRSKIDPGLISRTIKGLEDGGFLTTTRQKQDRRVVILALTPRGQRIFDTTMPHMQARQAALFEALEPAEQAVIFGIFDKLECAAEQLEFDP